MDGATVWLKGRDSSFEMSSARNEAITKNREQL